MIRVLLAVFTVLVDAWLLSISDHTPAGIVTAIFFFGMFRALFTSALYSIGSQFDSTVPKPSVHQVVACLFWPIVDLLELFVSIDQLLPGKKLVGANNG